MITKFLKSLVVVFFTLILITCQKNQQNVKQEPLPKYITAEEFVGNPEEFEEYSKTLFIPREEFLGDDENFITYVKVVNDERMQKGYFAKRKEEEAFAKQARSLLAPSKYEQNGKANPYPRNNGQYFVTDEPNASGSGYFAGHAAMVYTELTTIESFPFGKYDKPSGVQKHRNDWYNRYLGWGVYGAEPKYTSITQDQQAGFWATNQVGKGYNFDLWYYEQDYFFYCSQLVYRAHKNSSRTDLSNGASWGWVSPMDLIRSSNASIFYIR